MVSVVLTHHHSLTVISIVLRVLSTATRTSTISSVGIWVLRKRMMGWSMRCCARLRACGLNSITEAHKESESPMLYAFGYCDYRLCEYRVHAVCC